MNQYGPCIVSSTMYHDVLADEGAVLVELDVHAVSILSQRVITPQLTLHTQRRLAGRALLISITAR